MRTLDEKSIVRLWRMGLGPKDHARFWAKVNKNGSVPAHVPHLGNCWLWTGTGNKRKGGGGYGAFKINRRQFIAHRVAWEMEHGPIPAGMWILHRCDTPSCVRTEHHRLGTPAENTADMIAKGRHADGRGVRHSQAKLTDQDVDCIRKLYATDVFTMRDLGRAFDICAPHVHAIIRGDNWRHVPGAAP